MKDMLFLELTDKMQHVDMGLDQLLLLKPSKEQKDAINYVIENLREVLAIQLKVSAFVETQAETINKLQQEIQKLTKVLKGIDVDSDFS